MRLLHSTGSVLECTVARDTLIRQLHSYVVLGQDILPLEAQVEVAVVAMEHSFVHSRALVDATFGERGVLSKHVAGCSYLSTPVSERS